MPRPTCPRRISHLPPSRFFKPAGIPLYELKVVELLPEELEAMRLADVQDLYHVDAAQQMAISRQTFDRILRRAHRKVAEALVHGKALRIASSSPGAPPPPTSPAAASQ